MIKPWIWVYAISLGVGFAVGALAPARWGVGPTQSLLLGSAIYFGGLKRYVSWRAGGLVGGAGAAGGPDFGHVARALLPGVALRIAGVLLIAWLLTHACFDAGVTPDVRLGFVVVSTWLVAEGVIDRPERADAERLGARAAKSEGEA